MSKVFLLKCAVKNYEWGKKGMESTVAQLIQASCPDFKAEKDTPYAEMWMGTHPSGPSVIPSLNNVKLLEWMCQNPESLGSEVQKVYGDQSGLPFLFKVLSVSKSLSIQAHPDKPTGKELHKKFPEHYPDDNHKPEMAIALTNFEALCGFRPFEEIRRLVNELKQLQAVIGPDIVSSSFALSDEKSALKNLFTALSTAKDDVFKPQLDDIVHLFAENKAVPEICKPIRDLLLRVHDEYPGDIGCLALFFLNYIILNPGEAIYLAANEPHAYLLGDCIECMACSDNVIRAGLTPKFRDVNTLCEILSYNCRSAKENIFPSVVDSSDPCVVIYDPPVQEFTIAKIEIKKQSSLYDLTVLKSASILLVLKGDAMAKCSDGGPGIQLCRGSALFISSGSNIKLQLDSDILMFRAYCNL